MPSVRPAAVAGLFYPRDPAALQVALSACLRGGPGAAAQAPAARPKLIVVPHAGYVYSGRVAAAAYARLRPWASEIRRVVLLGPTHRVAVRGLAVPGVDAFDTPLGRVPLDTAALAALADLPQVLRSDGVHADEHALEVQLPFLQTVLDAGWQLVPLAVGDASADEVAEVLERLWGGPETLIVISSDLSHGLSHARAQARDRATVNRLLAGAADLRGEEACGAHALNGAQRALARHGLSLQWLDQCNSGDTAGDPQHVVGYAALWAAARPEAADDGAPAPHDSDDDGDRWAAALLGCARAAITSLLDLPDPPTPPHPVLDQRHACFVTLKDGRGQLRGCVGRLEADGRLRDDLRRHARAAAFDDPRFAPLRLVEWPSLTIEVSVLSASEPLPATDRAAAEAALRRGVDGVTVQWHEHRATLLPQVWHDLPDRTDFLAALWRKAGLAPGFWAGDLALSRYTARSVEGPAVP